MYRRSRHETNETVKTNGGVIAPPPRARFTSVAATLLGATAAFPCGRTAPSGSRTSQSPRARRARRRRLARRCGPPARAGTEGTPPTPARRGRPVAPPLSRSQTRAAGPASEASANSPRRRELASTSACREGARARGSAPQAIHPARREARDNAQGGSKPAEALESSARLEAQDAGVDGRRPEVGFESVHRRRRELRVEAAVDAQDGAFEAAHVLNGAPVEDGDGGHLPRVRGGEAQRRAAAVAKAGDDGSLRLGDPGVGLRRATERWA